MLVGIVVGLVAGVDLGADAYPLIMVQQFRKLLVVGGTATRWLNGALFAIAPCRGTIVFWLSQNRPNARVASLAEDGSWLRVASSARDAGIYPVLRSKTERADRSHDR